jgi:diacylglycerol kinase (ATP)
MKKAIFVYNPLSGDHSIPRRLDYIIGRFQSNNILLQPFRLFSDEHTDLGSFLQKNGFSLIIISGGDGTLNFVVNCMLKYNVHIPIGIIPSGTCNDFARSLNIPPTLSECIDTILKGQTIDVDVGLINDKQYFLSTCAGGLFVDVSFNTHHELKKNFGPFAYYLKALSELASIESFPLTIKTDTETVQEDVLIFLILNGKHGAGFSNLIEEADFSDGIMDIVLIKNCSHIDLASLFFKVLSNDYLENKHIRKLRTKKCVLQSSKNVAVSIDGEKGEDLPLTIEFINKVLKVFVKGG